MSRNSIGGFVAKFLRADSSEALLNLLAKAEELGLSEKDVKSASELINDREFSLAFETIVEQLYEFDIAIDNEFYNSAMELCESLGIDETKFSFLKDLIK